MSWNEEPRAWEPTQDILDFLGFAGVETTRDQLARLHRRRLIGEPFHDQSGGRNSLARYPAGTAERMLRISQLRSSTKQLDELAWRLWWEGFDVEPDLIRTYLIKRATRWDEQLREIRAVATDTEEDEKGERDVLDEVFFQHLKVGPAIVSARKRLGRGSELYAEFSALLIDLMHGDLSSLERTDSGLFERDAPAADATTDETRRAGEVALQAMQNSMDTAFIQLVASLDDKEIANARPVALRLLGLISNVGSIVQEVFGGSGHGRDNVGKSLITMAENSEEQVLSLLLTSSFLKDDRVREALPTITAVTAAPPTIAFLDFLRLRYLAIEVPGFVALLAPALVREAFATPEGAERWHARFDEYWLSHFFELEEAMALRPDLFVEEPLEPDEEVEILVETKKKNLK
ncbi:MAG: hypothetical protein ABSA07_01255 [Acidimicrobiales bacterium]